MRRGKRGDGPREVGFFYSDSDWVAWNSWSGGGSRKMRRGGAGTGRMKVGGAAGRMMMMMVIIMMIIEMLMVTMTAGAHGMVAQSGGCRGRRTGHVRRVSMPTSGP